MSGMDAKHPVESRLITLCRFVGGRPLRFGNPYCVFDKIVVVGFARFRFDSRKPHRVDRLVYSVYKNSYVFYHRFTFAPTLFFRS